MLSLKNCLETFLPKIQRCHHDSWNNNQRTNNQSPDGKKQTTNNKSIHRFQRETNETRAIEKINPPKNSTFIFRNNRNYDALVDRCGGREKGQNGAE